MNNEIYNKNISALKQLNPGFADRIQKSKIPEWIEYTNNDKNFIVKKSGKIQQAYPKAYNKEVNMLAKQKIYHKDTATVVIGIGCAHLLIKILRNMEKGHRVVVVEPVLSFIKNSMRLYDFSKWIEETELVFVTIKEEISTTLALFNEILVVQDWLTIIEPYVLYCEEYSKLISYTNQIIDQIRCNVGTVAGAGSIIAENDIKNLPYIIKHRGIKDLKDLYKGKPAILVATGAAINNNIHMLRDVQDNAIIISIAQGLRMMLAYDVRPDFITTVDYGEINYEHFRGLMDEDAPLVALNRTYAPILKHWQGPKFIAGTYMPGFEESGTGIIQEKGYLESGGSVAHLSFQLAKHLGCNPIIFIGHGYSFGRGTSHTEQVDAGGKIEMKNGMINWTVTDPRSQLKDKDQFQGAIVNLPGIFGDPSPVNVGLASFVTTFEDMFKKSTENIINASEEGTDMEGTINMTFHRVIDQHLYKKIDKSGINKYLNQDPNADKNINLTISRLKIDIENLEELIDCCEFGLNAADDMLKYKDNDLSFKDATRWNEQWSNKANACAKKNPLVSVAIYGVNRKIHGRNLKVKGRGKNLIKNLDTRVKRNKMILEAAKESAEKLLPVYKDVLYILTRYKTTGDDSLLQCKIDEKINLRDAKKYFKAGNWSHPFVDARKKIAQNKTTWWNNIKQEFGLFEYGIMHEALERKRQAVAEAEAKMLTERRQDKLDYEQYIKQAHDIGKNNKKFKESLRLLKKAEKLFPEKLRARWGIASTLLLIKENEKSLDKYKELIKDFPDNKRMKFEYGIGLIGNNKIQEGIDQIEDAMKDTHEFDHFLRNMGRLYLMQGDKKKGKDTLKKYLKLYPGDAEVKEMIKKSFP